MLDLNIFYEVNHEFLQAQVNSQYIKKNRIS